MSKYRINAAGVQKTLKATSHDASKFETELKPLDGVVQSAATACGGSGAIVPALETLFTYEGKQLKAMAHQVESCLTGAGAATTAYLHGDLTMMQECQRNAKTAKISQIPKKWLQH